MFLGGRSEGFHCPEVANALSNQRLVRCNVRIVSPDALWDGADSTAFDTSKDHLLTLFAAEVSDTFLSDLR